MPLPGPHVRGAFGLILLGVLGALAVLVPPAIGPTPVEGIEVTQPPWMFWWMYTLENWFGLSAILWAGVALFALLTLLPFVDRSPDRGWRRRPVVLTAVALIVAALVVLTLLVFVVRPEEHL
jgi:ubiquinol-cytochrome c reductase cytochrome b subunit